MTAKKTEEMFPTEAEVTAAQPAPTSRLSSYRTRGDPAPFEHLEDVQDQELKLMDWAFRKGNYGDYAVLELVDGEGVLHTVATGAVVIMDALQHVPTDTPKPLAVRFIKVERFWSME